MDALDILLEDLNTEQLDKLKKLSNEIKDPTNMKPSEASKIIDELGIDIESIQKKNYSLKKTKKIKIGANEPCHCGSNKKWKKCCRLKDI